MTGEHHDIDARRQNRTGHRRRQRHRPSRGTGVRSGRRRVAVADFGSDAAGATVAPINQAGGQAISLSGDVTESAQVKAMVDAAVAGLVGLKNATAYVAAKHGVVGLTKTAAMEYADAGVRVNAVCPGFIRTRMTARTLETREQQIAGRTPMGRVGNPEEIAEMVVWLCSDRASYVTGAAYAVDGGWTAT